MRKILNIFVFLLLTSLVVGQEKQKAFNIELHGFVGVNAYYDTRQSVTPRNGNIYLWPNKPEYDQNGKDMNDHGKFDLDAAFSRFGLHVSGPEVFGAKSFALLEADFLGTSGDKKNHNFRIRHAYIRLNWGKTTLLAGQTWHPLFLTENFPSTVNLNAGSPFHPLNRTPQLRISHKLNDKLEVLGYLLSQNDFSDKNLVGAMENSEVPEVDAQIKYKNESGLFAAFTAGYKTLKPQLIENNLVTDEEISSFHLSASFRKKFNQFTFKTEGLYGGNMTNVVMLGGVAKKTSPDNDKGLTEYVPLKSFSVWTDVHSNGQKVQPGIMFGYSQNLGASEAATPATKEGPEQKLSYCLGQDIGYMYAFSPRVKFHATPKIWLGVEWLHTLAAYGSDYNAKGKPVDLETVSNNRFITSLRYTF
ncbi:MAG: hypothetical protein JEZ14_19400 [Marinilabiliaceae bacterium]|nr:hypothetical protein [Marinilabiliaceae bacterium]